MANTDPTVTVNIDQDYPGGDYKNIRGGNLTECIKASIEDENCRAYTYNPSGVGNDGNPVCWLKNEVNSIASVNPNQNVVAGLVLGR